MLGALLGLFGLGAAGVSAHKQHKRDFNYRYGAMDSGKKYYIDRNGSLRSCRTNNLVKEVLNDCGYYDYYDKETGEKLTDSLTIEREERARSDEKIIAQRQGLDTYTYNRKDYLIENDLEVIHEGWNYATPKFKLRYLTRRNKRYLSDEEIMRIYRGSLYKAYKHWYEYHDTHYICPNIKGVINEAKMYGIKLLPEDIEHLNNRLDEEKPFESCIWDDEDYCKGDWVNEKYQIDVHMNNVLKYIR